MTTQRRATTATGSFRRKKKKKPISTKRKGNEIILFVPDDISYAANLCPTTVCVSNRNIGSLRTAEVFPVVAWVVAENMDHTSAVRRLEYGSFSLTSVRGVYGLGGYLLDLHNSSDDTPLVLSLMLQ